MLYVYLIKKKLDYETKEISKHANLAQIMRIIDLN